ncbi:MAG: porin [Methyloligellaceae bacterium]
MKTTSRLAVVAAAGLFMSGTAHAGGAIGGNCCADLEERVAELEATTARKGNRRVSLTVYGQVSKALLFSDEIDTSGDGTAIIDNENSASRFGFKGKARISSDLYAGYKVEFEIEGFSDAEEGPDTLTLRHNDVYIGSKTLGKLSIGQGSTASDGIAEIDLSGTALANGTSNLSGYATSGHAFDQLDGDSRKERVRYDSPTLAGFKVSASWQDNEDYDVALRFGSTFGDFTIAAGVAYLNEEDSEGTETVSGSVSALHIPTGLNVTFAAGDQDADDVDDEKSFYYVKGGIKRKVFAAGTTAFSVDYQVEEDAQGDEADKIGFQLVQTIDAAAMDLFVAGWSTEADAAFNGGGDEDAIVIGTRIQF